MVGFPSILSRGFGAGGAGRNSAASASDSARAGSGAGPKPGTGGARYDKPGQDAPDDLMGHHGNGEKPGTTWGDRLQVGGNVAMAGSMIAPMFQGHGDKAKEGAAGNGPEGPVIEDPTQYNQDKLMTAVGPPPINW